MAGREFITLEISLVIAALVLAAPANAFDPATDHKCVAYCDGGSAPSSGGGYAAPAPSGPSPAQIAAQRQRAQALALDTRAHAAFDGGDLEAAAQDFEEAARLAPNDSNILGNRWYTKGMLASRREDYESAIDDYKKALRYYPTNKNIQSDLEIAQREAAIQRGDWENPALRSVSESYAHYIRGRRALDNKEWGLAVQELRQYEDSLLEMKPRLAKSAQDIEKYLADSEKEKNKTAPMIKITNDLRSTLRKLHQSLTENQRKRDAIHKYLERALLEEKVRRDEADSRQPVYRDASTPRSYPDFASYTPAQHAAHQANEDGNLWAQKGDWVQALLRYQTALTQDPDGQFSKVIKENLAIAMKHLEIPKPKDAPSPASAAPALPHQAQKPEEITHANCTGWTPQTNGTLFHLCMDEQAHHYCEQADNKGVASRVNCP